MTQTALEFIRQRIERLETNDGIVAAELSALRSEMRTRFEELNRRFDRLDDMLNERPSRSELLAMPSKSPEIMFRGPFGLVARLKRVDRSTAVLLILCIAAVIASWLFRR